MTSHTIDPTNFTQFKYFLSILYFRNTNISDSHELIEIYKDSYEKASRKISAQYEIYRKLTDKHPDYNNEWNYYCLKKFNENPNIDYTSNFFVTRWMYIWERKLIEFEKEDLLREQVTLRQKLNLPVDPIDCYKLNEFETSRIKKKKAYEKELESTNRPENFGKRKFSINMDKIEEQVKSKLRKRVSSNDIEVLDSPKTPNSVHTISSSDHEGASTKDISVDTQDLNHNAENDQGTQSVMTVKELLVLYENFDRLPELTKEKLYAYMDMLKKKDVEMYNLVINEKVVDGRSTQGNKIDQCIESDSDVDDDYDNKLLKDAVENVTINVEAFVNNVSETVDLTSLNM